MSFPLTCEVLTHWNAAALALREAEAAIEGLLG